jgi:predicted metal-binding membrane protein
MGTAVWMLMMTVMMLPAVFPWLRGFAALTRTGGSGSAADSGSGSVRISWVALFALGYLTAWLAFSVGGASLQILLRSLGVLAASAVGAAAGASAGASAALTTPLAGVVLIGAGVYQATPAKSTCLEHCRTPMSFFLSRWRNGPVGALRMGATHGAFCVGCCWALMLTGFALGVMNLAWMLVLTVVIAAETLAPQGVRIGRLGGAGLVIWGLVLLASSWT